MSGWNMQTLALATLRGERPALENVLPPGDDTLAGLLDRTLGFLRRFVVLGDDEAVAATLFIAHSHALDAADVTPYLDITSAERRAGKTTLLDFLDAMTHNPWRCVTPSEAVTYRRIDANKPTLLLDEVDAIFGKQAREHEGLRALLNAGFKRRGSTVPRCVGKNMSEVKDFETFCCKALAGIGRLPDTIADRSIRIEMKRKRRSDSVARWREREAPAAAEPLRDALNAILEPSIAALAEARPALPDELNDRAQDAWEPLLAIADLAGSGWPSRARRAAVRLSSLTDDDEVGAGNLLLRDLRIIFAGSDSLPTQTIIDQLCEMTESPWAEWRNGKPITARGLGRLLEPYGVSSDHWRVGSETVRGYQRRDFEDVWERWLPGTTLTSGTSGTSGTTRMVEPLEPGSVPDVPDVPDVAREALERLCKIGDELNHPAVETCTVTAGPEGWWNYIEAHHRDAVALDALAAAANGGVA